MHPQIACMRGRIVTLIALVWLFPTKSPQMAYLRGCIFKLVVFVFLSFLRCVLQNVSINHMPANMHSHIGYIFLTFSRCVFSKVASDCLPKQTQSHTGCTCFSSDLILSLSCEFLFHHCIHSSKNVEDFDPSQFTSEEKEGWRLDLSTADVLIISNSD